MLFITPAIVFAFPGAYLLGGIVLSVMGVWSMFRNRLNLTEVKTLVIAHPMLWGFVAYSFLHIVLTIYHAEPARDFGNVVPFLVFPLALLNFKNQDIDPRYFWLGSAFGAFVALAIGLYQVYVLNVERAFGFRNPITFGDTAIVLASAALIGLVYGKSKFTSRGAKIFLLLGGLAGLLSSLLSGSKGGWLSLIMVTIVLTNLATRSQHVVKRLSAIFIVAIAFASVIALAPKLPVIDRVVSAYHGVDIWLRTGEVTEGSASIRLEAFKAGLIAGSHSPIVGVGRQGEFDAVREAVNAGLVHKDMIEVKVIDNDLISIFSRQGLIGVLGILAVHFGIFFNFWKHRQSSKDSIRTIAYMGMLLPILYFEFGLSISVFGTNIFRAIYISWSLILAGMILAEERGAASQAIQKQTQAA